MHHTDKIFRYLLLEVLQDFWEIHSQIFYYKITGISILRCLPTCTRFLGYLSFDVVLQDFWDIYPNYFTHSRPTNTLVHTYKILKTI